MIYPLTLSNAVSMLLLMPLNVSLNVPVCHHRTCQTRYPPSRGGCLLDCFNTQRAKRWNARGAKREKAQEGVTVHFEKSCEKSEELSLQCPLRTCSGEVEVAPEKQEAEAQEHNRRDAVPHALAGIHACAPAIVVSQKPCVCEKGGGRRSLRFAQRRRHVRQQDASRVFPATRMRWRRAPHDCWDAHTECGVRVWCLIARQLGRDWVCV